MVECHKKEIPHDLSQTPKEQVARCGNAVCPPMAAAVARANLPEWCSGKIKTMKQLKKMVAV